MKKSLFNVLNIEDYLLDKKGGYIFACEAITNSTMNMHLSKIVFFAAIIILLFGCTNSDNKIELVKNHLSDFTIVVSKTSDSLSHKAALELQKYIFEVSGAKLKIDNRFSAKHNVIIGKALVPDTLVLSKIAELGNDGFIIKTDVNNIIIAGNDGRSNLNAVYTFLEHQLGCRMLYLNEYYIPKQESINLPYINKSYEPAFDFRRHFKRRSTTKDYMDWHKLEDLDQWGSFVHTFSRLIPPEQYYDEHPEYFALVNGRRLMDGQLCLSNDELVKSLIENLRKQIEQQPEKKYWSVSQNDCYNYCECDSCKKLYDKYGSISGAYIQMANKIAQVFPHNIISTLAYQFTRSAPENIKPLPNVNIMFCSIECNRSKPLDKDPSSKSFIEDLNKWTRLSDNIFMWDYVVQFKNYLTPFPNIKVLQPNLQLFKSKGIKMAFQQGSGVNWSDLSELKQYLIANLLWNPDLNQDSLIDDFLPKYYGSAAPYIKKYMDLCHEALYAHPNERLNIYGFPMDYTDSYLSEDLLHRYQALMDSAEIKVKNDSIRLNRVHRARIPADFAYLDIALNGSFSNISFVEVDDNGRKILKKDMLEKLDYFVENTKNTGVKYINERRFKPKDYRKYALKKLKRMVMPNKAKNAILHLGTEPSEKYPAGGVNALNDNRFGDLDYHNNWLGFEGKDMILYIDFDSVQTLNKLSMNFLKAVNSWVFLPDEIVIESSGNGNEYKSVAHKKGDNSNRSYLVKSIPFEFDLNSLHTKHLRVKAISMKQCPVWHRGYGKPSWIFIDELTLN